MAQKHPENVKYIENYISPLDIVNSSISLLFLDHYKLQEQ